MNTSFSLFYARLSDAANIIKRQFNAWLERERERCRRSAEVRLVDAAFPLRRKRNVRLQHLFEFLCAAMRGKLVREKYYASQSVF
jgi:hypothetical protein